MRVNLESWVMQGRYGRSLKRLIENPLIPFLEKQRGVIISMARWRPSWKRVGADLHDALWSAKILLEDPALIRQVHLTILWRGPMWRPVQAIKRPLMALRGGALDARGRGPYAFECRVGNGCAR